MQRRSITRYTMRGKGGRINKFGITSNPARREGENRRAGNDKTMRIEGPKVTKQSALNWERGKIESYQNRNGRRPPGNKV